MSFVGDGALESGFVPSRESPSVGLILMEGRRSAIGRHDPSIGQDVSPPDCVDSDDLPYS